VQRSARRAYRLFVENPQHPSLQFKQYIRPSDFSARVAWGSRPAVRDGDDLIWFWVGSHADYDRLLHSSARLTTGLSWRRAARSRPAKSAGVRTRSLAGALGRQMQMKSQPPESESGTRLYRSVRVFGTMRFGQSRYRVGPVACATIALLRGHIPWDIVIRGMGPLFILIDDRCIVGGGSGFLSQLAPRCCSSQ